MEWKIVETSGFDAMKVKNHSAIFYHNGVFLYGGFDGTRHRNSLNFFDLATATLAPVPTEGPLPPGRNGHTATLYGSDVYIIGGWNSSSTTTTKEIYVLHLADLKWEKIEPGGEQMVSCNMHSANLYDHKIFVFRGGDGTKYLNDLHCYDIQGNTWHSVSSRGTLPTPRANHASAVFENCLYIFGGWNGIDRLNDLYVFSLIEYEWRRIVTKGISPKARAGMTMNPLNKGILLFGGSGILSTSYNDLFFFDVESSTWTECETFGEMPSVRAGHTLTEISKRELILIGGSSGNSYSTSFHLLDTKRAPVPPPIVKPEGINFRQFCNNPTFSDVQFLIEGHVIYAHKVIITRLSSHFNIMFTSGMRESRESQVEFKNIRYSVFMILLAYLYTGEVEVGAGTEGQELSVEYVIDILQTADRFFLDPISQTCERILTEKVNQDNVLEIQAAVEHTNAKYLKEYCAWYIECQF